MANGALSKHLQANLHSSHNVYNHMEQPKKMSQAFLWAIALHLTAAAGVIGLVKYWPVSLSHEKRVTLDCEVLPPHTVVTPRSPQASDMAQALAAVAPESRPPPAVIIPSPHPLPSIVTDPVIARPDGGSPQRPLAPDPASEDTQALVAIPLRATGICGSNTAPTLITTVAGQRDGGERPTALTEMKPLYPPSARASGQEGTVAVHLHVSSKGEVEFAEIGQSSGFAVLDQSAITTVRKARFKPAEHNGKAVPAELDLKFQFRLED